MIAFFDIETTGLGREQEKIIEIAISLVDDKSFNIIESFSTFVNPEKPIPWKITQLCGISNYDVQDAPFIEDVLPIFFEIVDKADTVAGHNIKTCDIPFVNKKADQCGIYSPLGEKEVIDTLSVAKAMFKENKFPNWNYSTPTGRPSFKLENFIKHYGLGSQNHRAIDDVSNNIEVYKRMLLQEEEEIDYGF